MALQAWKWKVAIFLTTIGPKTYGILRDLVAPAKPAEKSYAQLTKLLADHFSPKPVLILLNVSNFSSGISNHENLSLITLLISVN